MKKFNILFCILIVLVFTSCFSTPTTNNAPEAIIYFYTNPSTDYIEYEIISISTKSNLVIYSVDRDNALIVMEIGSYIISNGTITINAGEFQARGLITNEKIIIDDKEYIRS